MESRSRQVTFRELGVVVTLLAICFAAVTQGGAAVSSPLLFAAIILAQIASPLLIVERLASRSNGWITAALLGCYAVLICASLGLLLNDIPGLPRFRQLPHADPVLLRQTRPHPGPQQPLKVMKNFLNSPRILV